MKSNTLFSAAAMAIALLCSAADAQDAGTPAKATEAPRPPTLSPAQQRQELASHIADYRAKAALGDPDAQFKLGIAYMQGIGVPADRVEGGKWMRKAAQGYRAPAYAKNADALYMLGSIYAMGMGMPKDMHEATLWWEKSADLGNIQGQIITAAMYSSGFAVPRDKVKGDKWLLAASALGDPRAAAMSKNVEKTMTPAEISNAHAQAKEWSAAHPH